MPPFFKSPLLRERWASLTRRAKAYRAGLTRRRLLLLLRDFLLAVVALGTLFSLYNLRVQFPRREYAVYPRLGGYYDYRGVLGVRSRYSDGRATYGEIARIAHDVGLDFVVITDHETMQAREDGRVGNYGDLYLLCGASLTRPEGRLWILGPTRLPSVGIGKEATTATLLAELEGHLSVVAMPLDPLEPWGDFSLGGFGALEVVNLTSLRRRADPWRWLSAASARPIDGPGSLARFGIDRRPFALWDELTRQRPVVGLASADVTGKTRVIGDWHITSPSYPDALRTLQTHVLLPRRLPREPGEAFRLISRALREGNCYGSLAPIGVGSGFRFSARQGESSVIMGEELILDPAAGEPVRLEAYCPPVEGVSLVLIRDGAELLRVSHRRLSYFTSRPGVYRVEAWVESPNVPFGTVERLWLFSNPIYLRAAQR